jgi:hypothetical protein
MKHVKLYEEFVNENVSFSKIMKSLKGAAFPVTIVVHAKGTRVGAVIHQETVSIPDAVPANWTSLKKRYSTSGFHFTLEDATGKIVYQD